MPGCEILSRFMWYTFDSVSTKDLFLLEQFRDVIHNVDSLFTVLH